MSGDLGWASLDIPANRHAPDLPFPESILRPATYFKQSSGTQHASREASFLALLRRAATLLAEVT